MNIVFYIFLVYFLVIQHYTDEASKTETPEGSSALPLASASTRTDQVELRSAPTYPPTTGSPSFKRSWIPTTCSQHNDGGLQAALALSLVSKVEQASSSYLWVMLHEL